MDDEISQKINSFTAYPQDVVNVNKSTTERLKLIDSVLKLEPDLSNYQAWYVHLQGLLEEADIDVHQIDQLFRGDMCSSKSLDTLISNMLIKSTSKVPVLSDTIANIRSNREITINRGMHMIDAVRKLFLYQTQNRSVVAFNDLREMRFQSGKMAEYNQKYMSVYNNLKKMNLMKDQATNINDYIMTLPDGIAAKVNHQINSFSKTKSVYLEGDLLKIMHIAEHEFLQEYPTGVLPEPVIANIKQQGKKKSKCMRCNKDHFGTNCRLPLDTVCNYCGKNGHIAPACKKKKRDTNMNRLNLMKITNERKFYSVTSSIICDSGASYSITGDRTILTNIRRISPLRTRLPNGYIITVEMEGDLEHDKISIPIKFSSKLDKLTLLSVSDLNDMGYSVLFFPDRSYIKTPTNHQLTLTRCSETRLFRLMNLKHYHESHGHTSLKLLGISQPSFQCPTCLRYNIQSQNSRCRIEPDTLYADFKVLEGQRAYILVLVESRFKECQVYKCADKQEAETCIRHFVQSLSYRPKNIVTDIDVPFKTKGFNPCNIAVKFVPPRKHRLLLAERWIRNVMNRLRVVMHGIPEKFLTYACGYVAFTVNTHGKSTSAYFNRYKVNPPEEDFQPFFSKLYYQDKNTSGLEPKGRVGHFLGWSRRTVIPSANIYDAEKKSYLIRARSDIKFVKNQVTETPPNNSAKELFKSAFKKRILIPSISKPMDTEPTNVNQEDINTDDVPPNGDNTTNPDTMLQNGQMNNHVDTNVTLTAPTELRRSNRQKIPTSFYDPDKINSLPQLATSTGKDVPDSTNLIVFQEQGVYNVRAFELASKTDDEKKRYTPAILKEIDNLLSHGVLTKVDKTNVPHDAVVINGQILLETKRDTNDVKPKVKARLVARGDQLTKVEQLTKMQRYSPTVSQPVIFAILLKAAIENTAIRCIDIKSAFLQGDQPVTNLYMKPPYPMDKNFMFHITGNIYGLSTAGKIWFQLLQKTLKQMSFTQSNYDSCLFYRDSLWMVIHVDDILIQGNNDEIDAFISDISEKFKIVETSIKDYLGMSIEKRENGIFINHKTSVRKLLEKFNMTQSKTIGTPIADTYKCTSDTVNTDYIKDMRSVAGTLGWITFSRPDLLFPRLILACKASQPNEDDYLQMKRIVRYLCGTQNQGRLISKPNTFNLQVYVDASYATIDGKSVTGYAIFLEDTLVIANSRKQKVTSDSSTMAEMNALKDSVKDLEYILPLFREMQIPVQDKVIFHVDNSAVLDILYTNTSNTKSRHFVTTTQYIKDRLHFIQPQKIHTDQNIADMFTKPLGKSKFTKFAKHLVTQ